MPHAFHYYLHYCSRLENASVNTSDFVDEMDEIFFWIDETENILNSSIRPDEEYLEELMEKVKVGNLVSKFELINYLFVCFNLNNCSNTLRWYVISEFFI